MKMIRPRCLNCNNAVEPFISTKDENRKVTSTVFNYIRCNQCRLISLQNVPFDLGQYYADDYFNIPLVAHIDALARRQDAKMAAIAPFVRGGRLLEIGPAVGAFAQRATVEGYQVEVIERDAACCDFLSTSLNIKTHHSACPEKIIPTLDQHDVIALWHVIEHLENPFELFSAAAENLRSGGILVIGTPNPESYQFGLMKSMWPHIDAPRHVHLIPHAVLIERGKSLGLELCYLTTRDTDARSWNRFGWQRLFMNRLPTKVGAACGLALGTVISAVMAPLEGRALNGSAYTLTLRKC